MFQKLYIIVATIVAIAITGFAVISTVFFNGASVVKATTHLAFDSDIAVIATDANVLDLVGSSVDVKATASNGVPIEMAIGLQTDITAYIGGAETTYIKGMETAETLQTSETPATPESTPIPGSIKNDMWENYASTKTEIEDSWTKKGNSSWGALIVVRSAEKGQPVGPVSVSIAWEQKGSQEFIIPSLLLSLILLISCLVMYMIRRSKNAVGRHSGAGRKLVDLVEGPSSSRFNIPKTGEIPAVSGGDLEAFEKQAANQSLLNHSSFKASYPTDTNDSWRYYSDDSSNPNYENQISHRGAINASFGMGRQLAGHGANMDLPAAIPVSMQSEFRTIHRLEDAPESEIQSGLTRKQVRQKGLLTRKKRRFLK